ATSLNAFFIFYLGVVHILTTYLPSYFDVMRNPIYTYFYISSTSHPEHELTHAGARRVEQGMRRTIWLTRGPVWDGMG
ncbi:hypothetical protein C8R45DRAFT_1042065, partial [Mycena sanguinolenta]